ncbi:MAG: hypothetical protein EA405_14905 [Rhodospirillales bacterium]|nr:MAG: hypothetical protein EA405_14905 [Rhodospirillales bacterium]
MTGFDAEKLYALLPAIHRIRDAEQGGPLKALLAVVAEQVAVLEEDLEQSYDDLFIETCADWVTPYIGDLIGYRPVHGVAEAVSSPRAEVANTIAYRRRKGTAAMLEQLARDVTGWPARVVEYFELLGTTQYMNHLRPHNRATPDLRHWEPLERLDTAFDTLAHSIDVRSIARAGGRFNIPNIGIFLWRLKAQALTEAEPSRVDARRYRFNPLGIDAPLFTRPETEAVITHLAEPINVPEPISRRVLDAYLERYYGPGLSLLISVDGTPLEADEVRVCNLSDAGAGAWAHQPSDRVAIDPVLGRIAFPEDQDGDVRVSFHHGFSADIGGGEYERAAAFATALPGQVLLRVPDDRPTIQAALDDLPAAGGIVEITDNRRYGETLSIAVGAGASVELRAANGRRPVVLLGDTLAITGDADAAVTLDGLVLADAGIRVPDTPGNGLRALTLRHCTLVPGQSLAVDATPAVPGGISLEVLIADVGVAMQDCILGALRIHEGASVTGRRSILDAHQPTHVVLAGPGVGAGAGAADDPAGGDLTLFDCTVVGKVFAGALPLVSDSILMAALDPAGDAWPAPVRALRRQQGCLRFSFVPISAIGPRRFRCQPDLEIARLIELRENEIGAPLDAAARATIRHRVVQRMLPAFTTLRYGRPGYAQLLLSAPAEIRQGAEDEAEMGVFRSLYQPQRASNLAVRLEEYLRFGLEAGVFYAT